jgi:hypothetical protein
MEARALDVDPISVEGRRLPEGFIPRQGSLADPVPSEHVAHLRVEACANGEMVGKVIVLDQRLDNRVGRARCSEYVIPDCWRMARQNSAFHYLEGRWGVSDAQSSNGTHVNGRTLAPGEVCVLEEGDEIAVGPVADAAGRVDGGARLVFHRGSPTAR